MSNQNTAKKNIRVDFNYMMSEFIGDEQGIKTSEIENMKSEIENAIQNMKTKQEQMKWRKLPDQDASIVDDLISTAKNVQEKFDFFVVLGIGGSALGPLAVQQALNHPHYNQLSKEKRGGTPKLFVEDNVDPERMKALLDVIDIKKTCFNVITKSGSTSETMSQLLIVTDLIKKAVGDDWTKQVIATTDEKNGQLIKISKQFNLKTFYVPDGVGGRFSELCPVGLLAAAVCGIDIKELLLGASTMNKICDEEDCWKNPAYILAILQVISMRRGKNISVMMPYADSLKYISDWYAQLWAESLGKKVNLKGEIVYAGQTPVKALGVTDQHSQVQLYTEGPFDKVMTFLAVDDYRNEYPIAHGFSDLPEVSFLGGHTMNELIQAERVATEFALLSANRPSHTIYLPQVNAFTVGQLLFMLEMQTAFAGELLGINTFDQPGVEAGKQATYALLGKVGYDEKRKELANQPQRKSAYTIDIA